MAQGRLGLNNDVTGVSGGDAAVGGESNRLQFLPSPVLYFLSTDYERSLGLGQRHTSTSRPEPSGREVRRFRQPRLCCKALADGCLPYNTP